MKVIRNATLQFGLVNVPVGLATTASEKKVEFRMLHRKCNTPINQVKRCATCERIVEPDELLRGFEYQKDNFVTFEEEELESLFPERTSVISLSKFVLRSEFDPMLVRQTYYLLPQKLLADSYELLEAVIEKKGVIGIGHSSLWGKESPSAIVAENGILRLQLLWCADEIASTTGATDNLRGSVNPAELAVAEDIIFAMQGPLMPEDLISSSRAKLSSFLSDKLSGKQAETAVEDETRIDATTNLMQALRDSVEVARKAKKPAPRRRTTTPRKKTAAAKKTGA